MSIHSDQERYKMKTGVKQHNRAFRGKVGK